MDKRSYIPTDNFRVRALKVSLVFTLILCALISGVYLYLGAYLALAMIGLAVPLYLWAWALLKQGRTLTAQVLFLVVLTTHMTAAILLFSTVSGFHYYYFIVPTTTGLFFNHNEKRQRYFAGFFFLLALVLFLGFIHTDPPSYYTLTDQWGNLLRISSGFMTMLTIFAGFTLIAHEILKSNRELFRLATLDPLTGIFNRREFFIRGENEIERNNRYNTPLSLLMLDIDYFKRVNDTFGHANGDRVLKQFVQTCKIQIRSTDIFARLGGEEFALLLPESGPEEARVTAERIRREIENQAVSSDSEGNIYITVSIGISAKTVENPTLSRMIQDADNALYQAKSMGRNRVIFTRA